MSGLLSFLQPVCVHFAGGCVAAEGSPCAGEMGVTLESGPGSSSAALTLSCLLLVIIEARTSLSFCVVQFHSVMGEMAKDEGVESSGFKYSHILTF